MSVEDFINETVRYLNKPVWKATEWLLLNRDSSWTSTAQKAASIFAVLIAAPFAIAGETLHFASQMYYQRSYLSYTSNASPGLGKPQKFLNLNGCMFQGGLPIPFGGVTPASYRMDEMADFLKKQDADIVCMQEVAFDPATQLIDKLKDHYRYFYYRIGPNPYKMESALFWASKFPIQGKPAFIPFNVPNMQGGIRRGFFIAELEGCYVITTHLDPHAEQGEVRAQEIEAIIKHTESLASKPILLMGDLNIEAQDARALSLLKDNFQNFKEHDVLNPTKKNATCFDNLPEIIQNPQLPPKWSVVDHILMRGSKISKLEFFEEKIPTFNRRKLSAALSDHHAVVLELA